MDNSFEISRRTFFCTLPVDVFGKASTMLNINDKNNDENNDENDEHNL